MHASVRSDDVETGHCDSSVVVRDHYFFDDAPGRLMGVVRATMASKSILFLSKEGFSPGRKPVGDNPSDKFGRDGEHDEVAVIVHVFTVTFVFINRDTNSSTNAEGPGGSFCAGIGRSRGCPHVKKDGEHSALKFVAAILN